MYGDYMRQVLAGEGVRAVEPVARDALPPELDTTLLCFVLVDPAGKHAFCRCAPVVCLWVRAGMRCGVLAGLP